MEALVMMLINTKENTFHPILYLEKPFSGGYEREINQKTIRYKSKGHRTNGFTDRQDAVNSIETEIEGRIKELGYNLTKELEGDLQWDGIDMPTNIQIRIRSIA